MSDNDMTEELLYELMDELPDTLTEKEVQIIEEWLSDDYLEGYRDDKPQ